MSVFRRVKYAVFLVVALAMPLTLLAFILDWSTDALFYPSVSACLFAVAYVVAPMLERVLPLSRK